MKPIPSISAILPVRNGASILPRLLTALEKTIHPDCEILVIDDASSDGTTGACTGFPRVKVLRLKSGRGPAFARNFGAAAARGDIIFFLDSDVELPEGTDVLLEAARLFASEPALDAVCGPTAVRPLTQCAAAYNAAVYHAYYMERVLGGRAAVQGRIQFFATRCGAVRRGRFLLSGGFYETLWTVMNEDGEFGARVFHLGWSTRFDRVFEHEHHYPARFSRLARSYFLTALVQACVDARWDTSEDPSIRASEKGRRLLSAALWVLGPCAALHPAVWTTGLFMASCAAFAASFSGRLGALIFEHVPRRLWPAWFAVYMGTTPFILLGYLCGWILSAAGRSLVRGRPSRLAAFAKGWAG